MSHSSKKTTTHIKESLKSTNFALRLKRQWDSFLRFWGLRVIPFLNKLVLPGCAGVPLVQILSHFSNRDLWQSSKALAFSFLMALPPLLIFFFTLIPYLPIQGLQNEMLDQLRLILPESIFGRVSDTITDVMSHKHSSLLSIGFIGSIILAANGIHGLLQSFNSVSHSIEWRSLARRYLLCLILVVILYVLVVAILSLLIGYKFFIQFMLRKNFMAETTLSLFAFSFGRWIILVFLTLLTLSILYYLAPVKKQRINFFSIGSLVSTLLIFGLSWAFQVYINNFNNYNILYGSIGTLLVVMLWVYANCVVILAGYAINIAIAESREVRYEPSRRRKKEIRHKYKAVPHYSLRTENCDGRQPVGSHIYHSPSGISAYKKNECENG
ncbi:MAG: YihY/virulence factor BrkB family protein [Bacteroidales bacterium]|nr:YihY/virulence factor BrkB family protein [Bacteroidales bacterium]